MLPALLVIKNKCWQTKIYFPRKCQTLQKTGQQQRETRLAEILQFLKLIHA